MDKHIYLHAIHSISDYYDSKATLNTLKKILQANAILSARMQNKKYHTILFNGVDYISLCDYEKKNITQIPLHNAYEDYLRYSL